MHQTISQRTKFELMNISDAEKENLIEDYLDGVISEKDFKLFKSLIESDPEFKTQVELERVLFEEKRKKQEETIFGHDRTKNEANGSSSGATSLRTWIYRVAAGIILLGIVAWLVLKSTDDSRIMLQKELSVFELKQSSFGFIPDSTRVLYSIELIIQKNDELLNHYEFNDEILKLYLSENLKGSNIRLAFDAQTNMYLLFIDEEQYEVFPNTASAERLSPFNCSHTLSS